MATAFAETSEDDTSIFNQKSTPISSVKQSKINVTRLSRKKLCNLGVRFEPFPLLIGYKFWDSDTAVKNVFQKSLSARLRIGRPGRHYLDQGSATFNDKRAILAPFPLKKIQVEPQNILSPNKDNIVKVLYYRAGE